MKINKLIFSTLFLLVSAVSVSAAPLITKAPGVGALQSRSNLSSPASLDVGFDYITGADGASLTASSQGIFPALEDSSLAPEILIYEATAVRYKTPLKQRVRVKEVYVVFNRDHDLLDPSIIEGWQLDVYTENGLITNPKIGDIYSESYPGPTLGDPNAIESVSFNRGNNYRYGFPVSDLILDNDTVVYISLRPRYMGSFGFIGAVVESWSNSEWAIYAFDTTEFAPPPMGQVGFFQTNTFSVTDKGTPALKMVGTPCLLKGPCQ